MQLPRYERADLVAENGRLSGERQAARRLRGTSRGKGLLDYITGRRSDENNGALQTVSKPEEVLVSSRELFCACVRPLSGTK